MILSFIGSLGPARSRGSCEAHELCSAWGVDPRPAFSVTRSAAQSQVLAFIPGALLCETFFPKPHPLASGFVPYVRGDQPACESKGPRDRIPKRAFLALSDPRRVSQTSSERFAAFDFSTGMGCEPDTTSREEEDAHDTPVLVSW